MALTIPLPPQNMPAEVYSYLFQMVQLLNLSADSISTGTVVQTGGGATPAVGGGSGETANAEQYNELRSLIIKTADTINRAMEEMTVELSGEYVAQSDFGTYVEKLSAYLEANPEALTQYYKFAGDLQTNVAAVDAAFNRYRVDTQGYIRTGIVDYDGDTPVYGVAVGQNLTTREVDGKTEIEKNNFRAIFTAEMLSFWQGETRVAYLSNQQLYVTNIVAIEKIKLGSWRISSSGGFSIKWIGGV